MLKKYEKRSYYLGLFVNLIEEDEKCRIDGVLALAAVDRSIKPARSISSRAFVDDDAFEMSPIYGVVRTIDPEKVLTLFFND